MSLIVVQKGPVRRSRKVQAAALAAVTAPIVVFGLAGTALAAPAPTGAEGTINSGFDSLQGLVTGVLGLALFGITLAVLGIVMGIKWLRKGASA